MTAEEKLKELYEQEEPVVVGIMNNGINILGDNTGRVRISAKDIDLIANLVVERLKNVLARR